MCSQVVVNNNIKLWYETFGDKSNPAILLIMGACSSGLHWSEKICNAFAAVGFYVVRYDNRDTGRSTGVDFVTNPYNLHDLAQDAVGLLDGLDIAKAHIIGTSMGGYIAQLLGVYYSERVLSLTILTSSINLSTITDAIDGHDIPDAFLPPPTKEFLRTELEGAVSTEKTQEQKTVASWRMLNGAKAKCADNYFIQLFQQVERHTSKPKHTDNHLLAIANTEFNLASRLIKFTIPTLIIHGGQDPILPLAHGEAIANCMPEARFVVIADMGHMLTPQFWPQLLNEIKIHLCGNECS